MRRRNYYCTVELALDRLKGRWKPAIIYHLKDGPRRSGNLRRAIPGVSMKMFTAHLRELEDDEIIVRSVKRTRNAVEVTYRLSARAAEIRTVLDQLHLWGKRYATKRGIRVRAGMPESVQHPESSWPTTSPQHSSNGPEERRRSSV